MVGNSIIKICLINGIIFLLIGTVAASSINFNDVKTLNINTNHNGWNIEIIDTQGDVGKYSSLTLDSKDNPHIIYYDESLYVLKYAYKNGSTWAYEIVEQDIDTGWANTGRSIAVDSQDNIHVVYLSLYFDKNDRFSCKLKYAVRAGGIWINETLDYTNPEESPAVYPSIVLDKYDTPHIAYIYVIKGQHWGVKYMTKNGSEWITEVVAPSSNEYSFTSTMIAVDNLCQPHISLKETMNGGIYYASKDNGNWSVIPVELGYLAYPCIAVDSLGTPHMSYDKEIYSQGYQHLLMYATEKNNDWIINTVDTIFNRQPNIAFDSNNFPHISCTARPSMNIDDNWFLKYARWTGSEWEFMEVDPGINQCTGLYSSIAIDSNGMPHISYYDSDYDMINGDLRYASLISFPPSKPVITGQISGKAGKEYEYSIVSNEPDGDSVYYFVDWGDGTNSGWQGPYSSGQNVKLKHTWAAKGTFSIKVKARDSYNSTTMWEYLEVTMPKYKVLFDSHPFLNWLFEQYSNSYSIRRFILNFK